MELRLLGPIEVIDDDGLAVELPGGKPRLLLALLALNAGRQVSIERLVDALWGDTPPETAPKIVLGYISRLRKLLPRELLETRGSGYVLRVDLELDLHRFERLRGDAAAATAAGRVQ